MKDISPVGETFDLTSFGLTPHQSKIYQIGLQLGPSPASRIGRHASIHRVSTYNTLKELCEMGYATFSTRSHTAYYAMIHPSIIHTKLSEKLSRFASMQPLLESLINHQTNGLTVNTYQGFEGICSLYNLRLHIGGDTKAFLGVDHIDPRVKKRLYDVYLPKRIAQGIKSQTIVSASNENLYFADKKNVAHTEVLVITEKFYELQCEIILFGDKHIIIASLSSDELGGIHIESKYLYTSMVHIFDLIRQYHRKK